MAKLLEVFGSLSAPQRQTSRITLSTARIPGQGISSKQEEVTYAPKNDNVQDEGEQGFCEEALSQGDACRNDTP